MKSGKAVILLFLFLWAIVNWGYMLRDVTRFYVDLPAWDYFNEVEHLADYKAHHWAVFWQQHNEHRIVFPELVFATDLLLFRGRQIFPLVISCCAYLGGWLAMAWTLYRDTKLAVFNRLVAILLSAVIIGGKGSAASLGIPFLLQWPLVETSLILALVFLTLSKHRMPGLFLPVTIVSSVICTYSSGNGLLCWLVIIPAALLLRMRTQHILFLCLSGLVSVGLYFVGYKSISSLNLAGMVAHPVYVLEFISSFLTMPFSALGHPWFGVALGVVSLVVLAAGLILAVRHHLHTSMPGIVLFGFCLFAILSALLTAAGRMNPADPFFQAAKASRYLTMPLFYVSAVAMITLWIVARRFGSAPSLVVALILSLGLWKAYPKLSIWYHGQEETFSNQQLAAVCLESGVMNAAMNSKLYPDPGYVVRFSPILRANRLAGFSNVQPFWVGKPWHEVFKKISIVPAHGAIAFTAPMQGSVEVAGWLQSQTFQRQLVFVDENQRIVGLAQMLRAGVPSELIPTTGTQKTWAGFVNLAFRSQYFSTYVVDTDSAILSPLGERVRIAEEDDDAP